MMVAAMARQPQLASEVRSLTLLASKRTLLQRSLAYHLQVNLIWRGLARAVAAVVGYLPARALRIGADNETRLSLSETYPWLKAGPWRDPRDGFDYSRALTALNLPRCWLLAAMMGKRRKMGSACSGIFIEFRLDASLTASANFPALCRRQLLIASRRGNKLRPTAAWVGERLV